MANQPPPTESNLQGQLIGRLKAKLKEFGVQIGQLKEERDAAVKAREQAEKDYSADAIKAENDLLKKQIREGKHRAEFNRLAKERGAPDEALEVLYTVSGWEAKTDIPDTEAIGKVIDEAKAKDGVKLLFGSAPPAPNGQPPPKPGAGSGQGAPNGMASPYRIGDAEDPRRNDASWQYKNFDRIAAAAQERWERGEI